MDMRRKRFHIQFSLLALSLPPLVRREMGVLMIIIITQVRLHINSTNIDYSNTVHHMFLINVEELEGGRGGEYGSGSE